MIAGVDFSTFGAAVAVIDGEGALTDWALIPFVASVAGGSRAFYAARELGPAVACAPIWARCETAWVERGRGANRGVDWALGRAQGAIVASIPERVRVAEIEAHEWKAALGVKAGARSAEQKAQVRAALEARGYAALPTQDLSDALGIAVVAREQLLARTA